MVFMLASVGSAVGLGNFWRFPFAAGENGGAAFILIYLVCIICLAYPIMVAEYSIGRHGGASAVSSTAKIARDSGGGAVWGLVGWIGMAASFVVLTFYSVVAGWLLSYLVTALTGGFVGMDMAAAQTRFAWLSPGTDNFQPLSSALTHTIFMALTVGIVMRGLKGGIELAARYLMPFFGVMLVILLFYAFSAGDVGQAMSFLLQPDFSALTPVVVLDALGQALFSLGVGGAFMITFGGYLSRDVSIPHNARLIAGADTLVALLAGFALFPLVFAIGLSPAQGPGLFFITMPVAFGNLAFGSLFGGLFFLMAFVAAITSAIAILEIVVDLATERTKLSRPRAAIILGGLAWSVGIGCVLIPGMMGFLNNFASRAMLPVSLIAVAVLAGWGAKPELLSAQTGWRIGSPTFRIWRAIMRWAAPLGVGAMLILGLMDWGGH